MGNTEAKENNASEPDIDAKSSYKTYAPSEMSGNTNIFNDLNELQLKNKNDNGADDVSIYAFNKYSTEREDVNFETDLGPLCTNCLDPNPKPPITCTTKPVSPMKPHVFDDSKSVSLMPPIPQQQITNNAFSDRWANHNNNNNNNNTNTYMAMYNKPLNPLKRVPYLNEGRGQETESKPPVRRRRVGVDMHCEFLFECIDKIQPNITVHPNATSLAGSNATSESFGGTLSIATIGGDDSDSDDSDGNPYPPIYCESCEMPKQWANPNGGRLNTSKIIAHGLIHSRTSEHANFAAKLRGKSYMLPKQNALLKTDYLRIRQEIKKKLKKKKKLKMKIQSKKEK